MTDDEKAALADVYERAAEYLEEYGWRQHRAGSDGQPRCFIGATASACKAAHSNLDWYTCSIVFAEEVLELKGSFRPIIEWNDDPDRTKDEVINTLHALANKLR